MSHAAPITLYKVLRMVDIDQSGGVAKSEFLRFCIPHEQAGEPGPHAPPPAQPPPRLSEAKADEMFSA